jgi:WD40 repeat protein
VNSLKFKTPFSCVGGGPVYDVEFHPHEFLLAGGSHDRSVHFWDLEKFAPIGGTSGGGGGGGDSEISAPATGTGNLYILVYIFSKKRKKIFHVK